jgi:biotin operon repressor
MYMVNIECISCGKSKLDKDTVGINKKLFGADINNFYCMDCLAEYLGVTVEDLMDKIEEFKEQGCKLFG